MVMRGHEMAELRVLVFGSTGTGKTSLCNALTGQTMLANSSARGNTFETHTYEPFDYGDLNVHITDTVGLNESDGGTVPAAEAIVQLIELLESAEEGFNLLVHVFRAPRKTKNHDDNYKFFVEDLCQKKIPVILVATGCENEEPMSAWTDENEITFSSDGCDYEAIIATCFATGGRLEEVYAPLRQESKSAVLDAIVKYSLAEPRKIYGEGAGNSIEEVLVRVWNRFVDWAKLPAKVRLRANESVHDLMIRVGVPKTVADAAVEHIPDLAKQVAGRYLPPGVSNFVSYMLQKLLR
jgi:GTPase SAR1 family protein